MKAEGEGSHFWHDVVSQRHHQNAREMNATRPELIMQRRNVIQHELLPELRNDVGTLTPKLEKVIYVLEWVRIEEFTETSWCGASAARTGLAGECLRRQNGVGTDDHGRAD